MNLNQIKAIILGHAVGDALGVPAEFKSRQELSENPVSGMTGFGTYPYPAGTWSDDTSMSLCALDSLAKGSFDAEDIMRNFGLWFYRDKFTPSDVMFDVGGACSSSIESFFMDKTDTGHCGQTDEQSNGNGSLMRINPFVLFLAEKNLPLSEKLDVIHTASALTHAHERSKVGCGIYAFVLWSLLIEPNKRSIAKGLADAKEFYDGNSELSTYNRIFDVGFSNLPSDKIDSSGYIVDTLEASLWCVLTTDSYRECVLKAVNLGKDTDTTAAVAGGLAGALYGLDSIPDEWMKVLIRRDYIEDMCEMATDFTNKSDM